MVRYNTLQYTNHAGLTGCVGSLALVDLLLLEVLQSELLLPFLIKFLLLLRLPHLHNMLCHVTHNAHNQADSIWLPVTCSLCYSSPF